MDPQAMEEMTVSVAKHGILQPILFRTSAWTEDEKGAFNQTLQNLNESIQAILNPSEAPDNLA